jgi:tetratricopeptide (TPR) repeat protein
VSVSLPSKIPADLVGFTSLGRQAGRGQKYRHLGWLGVLLSAVILAEGSLGSLWSNQVQVLAGTVLAVSLLLINWSRIWIRESREPFKYTFSVADFELGLDSADPPSLGTDQIDWLGRDLTERLGDRVRRLSLLDEGDVPTHQPGQEPEAHVHVSGWYGVRQDEGDDWWIEVVPKVRVGGKGAPADLGNTVRFKLERTGAAPRRASLPPPLDTRQYNLLVERVYWAVASKIYAQIRRGVEEKAKLLPPGKLRCAAYLNEADDYAHSNTLAAFKAARRLYRQACEGYHQGGFKPPKTAWRQFSHGLLTDLDRDFSRLRRALAKVVRRFGKREIRAAEAQLGYGRMLVAEWHLRLLCGSIPKELYEAPKHIRQAIKRLKPLPHDIPGRKQALFRAHVTLALAYSDLENPTGAAKELQEATKLEPADAAEDSEFLIAEALLAEDPIRSLRLLTRAVEHDPKHERARFMKSSRLERLWRLKPSLESAPAAVLDAEYAEVLKIDPGNVSAWANRGYVGWLLSKADPGKERAPAGSLSWRRRALSCLDAGVRYKEVRRDAMVGELNWNLVRFRAEEGDFPRAYEHYLEAVSAMLGEPRMGFVEYFYIGADEALLERYESYETRVKGEAEAQTGGDEDRMIRSVLAFVLNDCGSAHLAAYQRLGDRGARERAIELFEAAIGESPRFVLPVFNLAVLEAELVDDETLLAAQRAAHLDGALEKFRKVIKLESHWTFPRLRLATLEARQESLRAELGRKGVPTRGQTAPGVHTLLQVLLPHRFFRENGQPGDLIDDQGTNVEGLVGNSEITWDQDFNEIQVVVLMYWAAVLAELAPEKAIRLSGKLQEAFYETHPFLLTSRIRAATALLEQVAEADRSRWEKEIAACLKQRMPFLLAEIREYPARYASLRNTIQELSAEDRARIEELVSILNLQEV